jgi:3-methylcrotonyl-CoA carboxylase alpha subunit
MSSRELHWNIGGTDVTVRVGDGTFHIADKSIPFQRIDANTIDVNGRRVRFHVVRDGNSYTVWLRGRTYRLQRETASRNANASSIPATGEITALMPGKLLRLEVAVGDTVSEKQTVGIMESMKMESALKAPKAGRIAEIRCRPGQVIDMGEVIMVID